MLRLEFERQKRGWSKSRLAREAGLNQVTVSLVCSGRMHPYDAQLERLARALGWQDAVRDLMKEYDNGVD